MNQIPLETLDDRTILLILAELTQQLRETLPENDQLIIRDEQDARDAIVALLTAAGEPVDDIARLGSDSSAPDSVLIGRQALTLALDDESVQQDVQALVEDPPTESQLSVELALAGAVVLGLLITWLQTKVDIQVTRQDGKTDFTFAVQKDAADESVIKDVARSIRALLTFTG